MQICDSKSESENAVECLCETITLMGTITCWHIILILIDI